ncbi:UNVERIFIED_CONTAM: Retrovirus-related Pol polyprotein from transposon RE1 [Sesamum radiatum]|uniref:Retrovirus-related Pol polyprotein from transposon RE1 n=1 Tax=Sesamum radiatum TaxID=300843 RepID=A0AAW2LCA1_SESRA
MDPLPDVKKAFGMILSVEKQRSMNLSMTDSYNNNSAYLVAGKENRQGYNDKHIQKRKLFLDKRLLIYDHCRKSDHSKESCFKLFGVPDWYKNLPEQTKKGDGVRNFAATVGNSVQHRGSNLLQNNAHNQNTLAAMMAKMLKLMKDKNLSSDPLTTTYANYAYLMKNLQDLKINKTLAKGTVFKGLYMFRQKTDGNSLYSRLNSAHVSCSATRNCNKSIWHRHLGHSSIQAMKHIPVIGSVNYFTIFVCEEPRSFAEVVTHPESRDAMNHEIQALEKNYTWRVTPLPAGKKATGCKWIYKTKLKADGNVERYKARLVAKGFNQVEGINYTESFCPVAKAITVKVFLALAASYAWPIQQLDINNAFLHGYLDEDLYMLPLKGYNDVKSGLVCKLELSLYGLKLESRQWNLEFTIKLEAYGFVQSAHDYCLFTMITDFCRMFLLVYVDNILITGPSLSEIQKVKSYLYNLFTIKDLGDARYFLGLEISRNSSSTYLAQYTLDIIKDAGLLYSKAATTPLPHGSKFTDDCGAKLQHPDTYRRLIGHLLYLGFTKLDISHSV